MRTKANLVRSSLGSAAWQDYGGNTACVCGGGGVLCIQDLALKGDAVTLDRETHVHVVL